MRKSANLKCVGLGLSMGLGLMLATGCGSMRASRSVRAAGYPVDKASVTREMGKKTVYVYMTRPVTEPEREDITTRVLGAVPNATDVVVYPLPGTAAPQIPGNSTPRPNVAADGSVPATPATPTTQPQANPNSVPRANTPQGTRS